MVLNQRLVTHTAEYVQYQAKKKSGWWFIYGDYEVMVMIITDKQDTRIGDVEVYLSPKIDARITFNLIKSVPLKEYMRCTPTD